LPTWPPCELIIAAAFVSSLIEVHYKRHLLRFQKLLASYELLIIDEPGFMPLSNTGSELLFEIFNQRYRGRAPELPRDGVQIR
jgi:DNA replication protein DnaC